jgi:hypothetical protein
MLENKVLKIIFSPKREVVDGKILKCLLKELA